MTLYQTKHNQTEEKLAYLAVCEGLSRRIDYQIRLLAQHPDTQVEPIDLHRPDSSEGLRRILSAMYAHTSNLVVSATLAHLLLSLLERFQFSHEYDSISLPHLIDWFDEKMDELFLSYVLLRLMPLPQSNYLTITTMMLFYVHRNWRRCAVMRSRCIMKR